MNARTVPAPERDLLAGYIREYAASIMRDPQVRAEYDSWRKRKKAPETPEATNEGCAKCTPKL